MGDAIRMASFGCLRSCARRRRIARGVPIDV
jgi:hypothetical protein